MKYLKKTTALLLTVLLLFSAMVTGFTVSAEANTATITAAAVEVEASGTVNVPVKVTTTGLAAAVLTITVDDALTIDEDSIVNGEQFAIQASDVYNNVITVAVTAAGDANVVGTDIALISFDVTAPAEAAEAMPITVAATDTSDWAEAAVTVSTVDGSVTIASEHVHTEGELISATPAVGDASHNHVTDGSVVFACATCGEQFTQKVTYYRFYACATTNMVFESEILYQFNARDVHLEKEGNYEKGFIKIIKPYAGVDESEYDYIYSDIADAEETTKSSYKCRTWTVGVPAKELTDVLTANVFVKRGGVWYSGQQTNKSTKDMAMNLINNAETKDTEKKLLANMLVFGSKMQTFKKYNTDALADADLTGDLASLITTTEPTVNDNSSNPYDSSKDQVIINSFALDMGSKVSILYKFRTDYYSGEDAGLKAVLTYDDAGDENKATYLGDEDATDKYELISGYTDRYQFYYDKLPAKYMRTNVTLRMYDASDVEVGYTNIMSIESLVARLVSKTTTSAEEKAALYAMINYGDAAAVHFGV